MLSCDVSWKLQHAAYRSGHLRLAYTLYAMPDQASVLLTMDCRTLKQICESAKNQRQKLMLPKAMNVFGLPSPLICPISFRQDEVSNSQVAEQCNSALKRIKVK